jgi:flagella basal body P-ring formation protein FlgA
MEQAMPKARMNRWGTRIASLGFLLSVTLALTTLPVCAAAGRIALTMPESVTIDSANVRLGQIVQISGADPAQQKQLQAVTIGRAPQAGRSRSISREYILLRLRQSGLDPAAMSISAPQKITLTRRAVKIAKSDLEMMIRAHVAANPPFGGGDLTISTVRISDDILLPTGDIQHEIRYLPQARPSGTLPLTVSFRVDGKPVKRVMVTVNVTMMKPVPVTRRPIARHQMIREEDLMLQTMDVTGLPANAVLAFQEIEGQRARRQIGPRMVLRRDQLEFPPVVKKGDRVRIVAETGGLRITALGEVKSLGRVGERVRVVNLDSNKSLFARVIDAQTVQVDF